tara:strand:+ start:9245 stop:9424 length:180 start_codon:yes stop_codon:yes gene_type:complete
LLKKKVFRKIHGCKPFECQTKYNYLAKLAVIKGDFAGGLGLQNLESTGQDLFRETKTNT